MDRVVISLSKDERIIGKKGIFFEKTKNHKVARISEINLIL